MDTRPLEESVRVLREQKDIRARLQLFRKVEYLDSIARRYAAVAPFQVATSNRAKGIEEGTPQSGEE